MNVNVGRAIVWACLPVLGCSSAHGAAQPETTGAGGSAGGANCTTTSDAATGTGTVTGAVRGVSFGEVANSLWIGSPDGSNTTVVYLFSKPVACSSLCSPGWDARITDGTQILELKALGLGQATFPVVKTATPAAGEAVVNSTIASTSSTPTEVIGSGGSLTLISLQARQVATGAFDLQFATDKLSGSFSAVYCPEGHEP